MNHGKQKLVKGCEVEMYTIIWIYSFFYRINDTITYDL